MFPFALLLIPVICFSVAQLMKFFTNSLKGLSVKNLSAYGGMPSAHTAAVVSLAVVALLHDGINSMTFVISVILAVLIIRDAIGLRMALSKHGRFLNKMVKDLPTLEQKKYPRLGDRLGHTPMEVLVGAVLAIAISVFLYYLFV